MRSESVALAVRFLSDPKVQTAPLNKRIAFLESKGLTSEEIEEALKKTSSSSASSSSSSSSSSPSSSSSLPSSSAATTPNSDTNNNPSPPPLPPYPANGLSPIQQQQLLAYQNQHINSSNYVWNWKDYTIASMGAVGVGYTIVSLAQVNSQYVILLYRSIYSNSHLNIEIHYSKHWLALRKHLQIKHKGH
jgi:peroxin-14